MDYSIPRNGNYFITLNDLDGNDENTCAANVILSLATLYQNEKKAEKSSPDTLFAHVRIPGESQDEIHCYSCASHCAILYKGSLFTLDVLTNCGELTLPASVISEKLASLKNTAEENLKTGHGDGADLSTFTCLKRSEWKQIRTELQQDIRSKRAIQAAESSMFVFSIDDDQADAMSGVGSYFGDGNTRWFDHSLNVSLSCSKDKNSHRLAIITEGGSVSPDRICEFSEKLKQQLSSAKPDPTDDKITDHENVMTHHPASIGSAVMKNMIAAQPLVKMASEYKSLTKEVPISINHLIDSEGITAAIQIAASVAYFKLYSRFGLAHLIVPSDGQNEQHEIVPISGGKLKTYIQAACDKHPQRLFQENELRALLRQSISEVQAEIRKAARGEADPSPAGHYPSYTSRVIKYDCPQNATIYFTPKQNTSLHFTSYHSCKGAKFSFVWCRSDFDNFADTFITTFTDTQNILLPKPPPRAPPVRRPTYVDREMI